MYINLSSIVLSLLIPYVVCWWKPCVKIREKIVQKCFMKKLVELFSSKNYYSVQEFKILPSWIEQKSSDQNFPSPVDEKCCMKELIGLPAVLLPQRDETKILGNLRLYPVVVIWSYSSNIRWLSGGWWFWVCRNYEKNLWVFYFILFQIWNVQIFQPWIQI